MTEAMSRPCEFESPIVRRPGRSRNKLFRASDIRSCMWPADGVSQTQPRRRILVRRSRCQRSDSRRWAWSGRPASRTSAVAHCAAIACRLPPPRPASASVTCGWEPSGPPFRRERQDLAVAGDLTCSCSAPAAGAQAEAADAGQHDGSLLALRGHGRLQRATQVVGRRRSGMGIIAHRPGHGPRWRSLAARSAPRPPPPATGAGIARDETGRRRRASVSGGRDRPGRTWVASTIVVGRSRRRCRPPDRLRLRCRCGASGFAPPVVAVAPRARKRRGSSLARAAPKPRRGRDRMAGATCRDVTGAVFGPPHHTDQRSLPRTCQKDGEARTGLQAKPAKMAQW